MSLTERRFAGSDWLSSAYGNDAEVQRDARQQQRREMNVKSDSLGGNVRLFVGCMKHEEIRGMVHSATPPQKQCVISIRRELRAQCTAT